MTIKANFPAIKPSLNLDFANSKVLDPRITFSRSSTATYYDGKTVSKAEENLWYPSNDGLVGSVEVTKTANAAVAPDGTTTALLIVPSTVTGNHVGGYKSFPVVDAVAFFSFYVKASGYDKVRVGDASSSRIYGTFDLTALSVTASGGPSYLDSGIIDVGNGWRRCWIKYNNVGSPGFAPAVTPIPTGATVNNYGQVTGTGDGTSGVYFWGFQVEQRSALTALTQTTTAPITNYIPALQTAAANVARFDHDPVTGESKGLLIEEQRTNLFVRSSDFTSGTWAKTAGLSVTPNAVAAPDGTISGTAVSISQATQMTQHATAAGTAIAFSIYAKAGAYTSLPLGIRNGTTSTSIAVATLYFSTGTIASLTGTSSLSYVGNGWYRATLIASAGISVGDTLVAYAAQGSVAADNAFYLWGAQLETGAFPTSYIPTTTAQVTRSADTASITGTNFSSWYRADEGTLFASGFKLNSAAVPKTFASINDGTATNRIMSYVSTNSPAAFVAANSTTYAALSAVVVSDGALVTQALAFKTDDFAYSANGGAVVTDTSGVLPVVNRLDIGQYTTGFLNGAIKRISYYPKRLSNTQLQSMTS